VLSIVLVPCVDLLLWLLSICCAVAATAHHFNDFLTRKLMPVVCGYRQYSSARVDDKLCITQAKRACESIVSPPGLWTFIFTYVTALSL